MNINEIKILYKKMYKIREVELFIKKVYKSDVIKSPVHLSIGQEAISVGICENLNKGDFISNGYRCHASYIAKNGNLNKFLAELYGKSDGCGGGKAGSMHMVDIPNGILGSSAVVASTIPVSAGYAWALKQKYKNRFVKQIVVSFFGDGATEEGCFYETINFSALHKLPILFVCENNGLAIHSKLKQRWANENITKRVSSFGIKSKSIIDNDIFKIKNISKELIDNIREGKGPYFLECKTYRWLEHVGIEDDHDSKYRDIDEFNYWKLNDQLSRLSLLINEEVKKKIHTEVDKEIMEAVSFAEKSKFPNTKKDLLNNVYAK